MRIVSAGNIGLSAASFAAWPPTALCVCVLVLMVAFTVARYYLRRFMYHLPFQMMLAFCCTTTIYSFDSVHSKMVLLTGWIVTIVVLLVVWRLNATSPVPSRIHSVA